MDEDIDPREKKTIETKLDEWMPGHDAETRKTALATGMANFGLFKQKWEKEGEFPKEEFSRNMELLSLNLSFENRIAIVEDLAAIAESDADFSEPEEGFIGMIQQSLGVEYIPEETEASKKLSTAFLPHRPESVLQSLAFLCYCLAGADEDIDPREKDVIAAKLDEWLPGHKAEAKKRAVAAGEEDYHQFKQAWDEQGCIPRDAFNLQMEFLTRNLTPANRIAILKDFESIAHADGEYSEEEKECVDVIKSHFGIDDIPEDARTSKELPASHFSHRIRFSTERKLTDAIRELFSLDALYPMVSSMEHNLCLVARQQNIAFGHGVMQSLAPRVRRLVDQVIETLGINYKIECFIVNQPIGNAFVSGGITPGGDHFITISSDLVQNLGDDELLFVIGHEIGHVLFNANDIGILLSRAYDENNSVSWALDHLLATWSKLVEFTCDRMGLIACGDKSTAITTLYTVVTGLKSTETGFDPEDYLANLEEEIVSPEDFAVFRTNTHPPLPLRIKALDLFAESSTYEAFLDGSELPSQDDDLRQEMASLVRKIDYYSDDSSHALRLLVMAVGGLSIAHSDDGLAEEELRYLQDRLRKFVLDPQPVLDYVYTILADYDAPDELLYELLQELVVQDPDSKYHVMEFLFEMASSDNRIHRKEIEFLCKVGQWLGLENEQIFSVFVNHLGKGFLFEGQVTSKVADLLGRPKPFFSKDYDARMGLACDEDTDATTLEQLSNDASLDVRGAVLMNQAAPEHIRKKLLDSPAVMERVNLRMQQYQESLAQEDEEDGLAEEEEAEE